MKSSKKAQSKQKVASNSRASKQPKASWTEAREGILLRCFSSALQLSSADSGLKSKEWTEVLTNFNKETKLDYTKQQLQSHINVLKKDWTAYAALETEASGLGCEDGIHIFSFTFL